MKESTKDDLIGIGILGPFFLAFIGGPIVIVLNLLGIIPTPDGMQRIFNLIYFSLVTMGILLGIHYLINKVQRRYRQKKIEALMTKARNEPDEKKKLEICAEIVRMS
jgi:hypothetical protein